METADLIDLASDFDRWRDVYDDLSFADQKVVYERIRELYPNQRSFTVNKAYTFFDKYQPGTVVELGGWDGFLAACILGQHPEIRVWTNYDLTNVLQSCVDSRYRMCVLDEPAWAKKGRLRADCFVATHTIEHIKEYELRKLVKALFVDVCMIEAPLGVDAPDWVGYGGTHVLEVGWAGVDAIFAESKFMVAYSWDHGRYYAR